MASIRTAKGPIEYRDGRAPEWLQVIWESQAITDERGTERVFGKPELSEWWAGGTVEEYEHARVIHRIDPSVSIVSKTEYGHEVLVEAAKRLGIHCN